MLESYPQHVTLCYIPKTNLVKEFVKVKPGGFWFHEKYHTSVQSLITWFKANFKDPTYRSYMKRCRSPKIMSADELKAKRALEDNARRALQQAASSAYEDEPAQDYRPKMETKRERNWNDNSPRSTRGTPGKERGGGRGRGSGGGGGDGCFKCGQ